MINERRKLILYSEYITLTFNREFLNKVEAIGMPVVYLLKVV